MSPTAVREQFLEKSLADARDAASKIREVHLRAEVLAVIASVSDDMEDYKQFSESIGQIPRGEFKSTALAAIAKRLAKNGKFSQARETVHSIRITDHFWRAEAVARIALYSRQPADFGEAKKYAQMINDPDRMREVFEDIAVFETSPEDAQDYPIGDGLECHVDDLVVDLVAINEFDAAHDAAANSESDYLRGNAFALMAKILKEAIAE